MKLVEYFDEYCQRTMLLRKSQNIPKDLVFVEIVNLLCADNQNFESLTCRLHFINVWRPYFLINIFGNVD